MTLANIVGAFMGGLAGAGFGGVQFFVMCAGICLYGAVTGAGNVAGIAFSPMLNPCTTFLGAACASGYANFKGYEGGGHGAASSLMHLKKIDVLLVGGVTGVLGWILNDLLGKLGLAGLDTVAVAVVIIPLLCKIIFQKSALGKVPDEDKALGGRFSPLGGRGWCAGMRRGIDKVIWPAAYGACIAIGWVILTQNGSPNAGLLGFGFGGFVLLFPTVPAQHFIGCTVCTAIGFSGIDVAADNAFLIATVYGIGYGALAANMADLCADLFFRYSYVHVDIPAGSIALSTLIVALLNMAGLCSVDAIWVPIALWVVFLAYGLFYDMKWKKFAATKGLSY